VAIITICRGTRSGGQALAECVADQLGYPIADREVLQAAAADLGVSEQLLTARMREAPKLWDRYAAIRRVYVVGVQAALAERIVGGDLVYHGLAGQLLLQGLPAVLRVRLIAPVEARIRRAMETDGLGRSAAVRFIAEQDAVRARWVRMMYGQDIADPRLYDMVVNLETMSVPEACTLLEQTLRQPDFEVSDAVRATFADFRLACLVKLALVRTPETRAHRLEVTAERGIVEISGRAPLLASGETGDRIAAIARGVSGVAAVRLKLQWYDPYP
jgi:cytidylate kinase